jgi:hypothetical protein
MEETLASGDVRSSESYKRVITSLGLHHSIRSLMVPVYLLHSNAVLPLHSIAYPTETRRLRHLQLPTLVLEVKL